MSALMVFAGWFHYHKAAPKLEWFQNAESMLKSPFIRFRGLDAYHGQDTKFTLHYQLINY